MTAAEARVHLTAHGADPADLNQLSDDVILAIVTCQRRRETTPRTGSCPICRSGAYPIGDGLLQCEREGCTSFHPDGAR